MLARLPVAVAVATPEGRFAYISPALRTILGRDPAERIGADIFENVHPDDVGYVRGAFLRLLEMPGGMARLELRGRRADGSFRWLRLQAHNLLDDPLIGGVLVFFWDIHEERLQREAVEARELRLRLAREAARLGFWEYDPDSRTVGFEHEKETWFGHAFAGGRVPLDAIVGLMHPEDVERARPVLGRALDGANGTYAVRVRIRTPEGSYRWCEIRGRVVEGRGERARLVGTYQDVTEEVERTEALAVSEARYRTVAGLQFEAIYEWDVPGGTLEWSEGLRSIFGHDPERVDAPERWWELTHPADREAVCESVWSFLAGSESLWEATYRFRDGAGEYRWVHERGVVVRDETGRAVRMIGALRDVTAERRLQQAELQAARLDSLAVMAAGVAHDFNNFLAAILGNAGVLRLSVEPEGEAAAALADLEAAARRASQLVRQLLDFAGRAPLERVPVDLARVAEEAVHVATRARTTRATVRIEPGPAVHVQGDESLLLRALVNLLTNALDALGEGPGRVTIRYGEVELHADQALAEGYVPHDGIGSGRFGFVEVEDTGPGMPPEVAQRVFEPFFTTRFSGRGLGLATVLGIVRRHEGAVRLHSVPGVGTTVRVVVPLWNERG